MDEIAPAWALEWAVNTAQCLQQQVRRSPMLAQELIEAVYLLQKQTHRAQTNLNGPEMTPRGSAKTTVL